MFELGNTVVMVENKFWYQRDREKHNWTLNSNWMVRYFDAGYDVIEIDYDEKEEEILARRQINGFWSANQDKLLNPNE